MGKSGLSTPELILALTSEVFGDFCHNLGEGGQGCVVPKHDVIQWQDQANPPWPALKILENRFEYCSVLEFLQVPGRKWQIPDPLSLHPVAQFKNKKCGQ